MNTERARQQAKQDWRDIGEFRNPYPTYSPEYNAYEEEARIILIDFDNRVEPDYEQ